MHKESVEFFAAEMRKQAVKYRRALTDAGNNVTELQCLAHEQATFLEALAGVLIRSEQLGELLTVEVDALPQA